MLALRGDLREMTCNETTAENDEKYLKLYNRRVIALILMNISWRWNIKGSSNPLIHVHVS